MIMLAALVVLAGQAVVVKTSSGALAAVVVGSAYTLATAGDYEFGVLDRVDDGEWLIVTTGARRDPTTRIFRSASLRWIQPGDVRPTAEEMKNERATKVAVVYDRFKNQTTMSSALIPASDSCSFSLSLATTVPGEKLTRPPAVFFIALLSSDEWRFIGLHDLNLIFILDGHRVDVGKLGRDNEVTHGGVLEIFDKEIPLDRFEQITKAKLAEFQIATEECKIDGDAALMFRGFLSKIPERKTPAKPKK